MELYTINKNRKLTPSSAHLALYLVSDLVGGGESGGRRWVLPLLVLLLSCAGPHNAHYMIICIYRALT